MATSIGKLSKSFFIKLLLGIIIFPFVFWGMGDVFRGGNQNVVATIGSEKISTQEFLRHLRQINLNEEQIQSLKKTNLVLPLEDLKKDHVYHLFTIYHPKASQIIKKMSLKKIQLRKIYPHPVHLMKAYKKLSIPTRKKLLKTNLKSKGIFCLPLYPNLKSSEMVKIVNSLKKILLDNKW